MLHAAELAVGMYAQTAEEGGPDWIPSAFRHPFEPDTHRYIAVAYLALAAETDSGNVSHYATRAGSAAEQAMAGRTESFVRERAYTSIDRAYARFLLGDVVGGCDDAGQAIALTERVVGSARLRPKLRTLLEPSHRHRANHRVKALRLDVARAARPRPQA